MSKGLRTEVPEEAYEWMRKNAPLPADTSDSALVTYWLQYAFRQYELETVRAAGEYPRMEDRIPPFDLDPSADDED